VGVTGTNGKTSTTATIASLLGELGRPVARVTTVGSFLDDEPQKVPAHYPGFLATMQRCRAAGGRFAAVELTSEALGLGFAKAWPWRVGVFTNLSHDHSDVHPSVEHYLACKAQLFMALPAGGVAVLNARDPHAQLIAEVVASGVETLRYGVPSRGPAWAEADISAARVSVSLRGTRIELERSARFPALPAELDIRAVGEIFAENALAALAAALAAGVPIDAAVTALATVLPPPGRFELVRERPCVIVDYAHTPDALARTLSTARQVCEGKVTLVFGAGGERDREKRPLLGAAARRADRIVLTSDNPRGEEPLAIMAQVAAGIGAHPNTLQERDRARAIRSAIAGAEVGDLVLITGKGHEQTQEEAGALTPFSDVAIVRDSPGV
jgi:UDP-N-acetylmuramoyl-L-alanyl-D-glutamate--2,6-diaminopimelate ligase